MMDRWIDWGMNPDHKRRLFVFGPPVVVASMAPFLPFGVLPFWAALPVCALGIAGVWTMLGMTQYVAGEALAAWRRVDELLRERLDG